MSAATPAPVATPATAQYAATCEALGLPISGDLAELTRAPATGLMGLHELAVLTKQIQQNVGYNYQRVAADLCQHLGYALSQLHEARPASPVSGGAPGGELSAERLAEIEADTVEIGLHFGANEDLTPQMCGIAYDDLTDLLEAYKSLAATLSTVEAERADWQHKAQHRLECAELWEGVASRAIMRAEAAEARAATLEADTTALRGFTLGLLAELAQLNLPESADTLRPGYERAGWRALGRNEQRSVVAGWLANKAGQMPASSPTINAVAPPVAGVAGGGEAAADDVVRYEREGAV